MSQHGNLQRICFCLQIKPHLIAAYKSRHEAVWPEMLRALREAGWHNYSLFLREDGLLVGYLETPDFSRALSQMAITEVNKLWQAEMSGFFEGQPGLKADEQMTPLSEIFHLP
jgi:L-rhamnose mutarotase